MILMSKCSICGRLLKKDWADKCFDCWKRTEFPANDIKDVMKRLGETTISGKKRV